MRTNELNSFSPSSTAAINPAAGAGMGIVNIDYLNFTMPVAGLVEGTRPHQRNEELGDGKKTPEMGGTISPFQALSAAARVAGEFAPTLVEGEVQAKGLHGYAWTLELEAQDSDTRAILAAGGRNHESVLFTFTGAVCGYIDYKKLHEIITRLGGRITRVDLALDDMKGEYTVHDVREAYKGGAFKNRGQTPTSALVGPWDTPEKWGQGLAYYVGKIQNGKTLCVYEKGKQLGDEHSPWLRFEVRLSRQDRDIATDVLVDPGPYFYGAYSWLERLSTLPGELRGFVTREETQISILHLVDHCKKSYGKVLYSLRTLGLDVKTIFDTLAVIGTPARVHKNFFTAHVREIVSDHLSRAQYVPT